MNGAPTRTGPPPVVAALTLGCKLNYAETQQAARELRAAGCATVDRPARADAWLINSCTVTHVADRKARRLIRLAGRLSPGAPVIVTGCYADRDGGRLRDELGAVVIGNDRKREAAGAVLAALGDSGGRLPAGPDHGGRTRAFLKIQEGCDDVCGFCIVPRVRGRERAVPIPEVVAAANERAAEGVREIVLTGTQPGAYGRDRADGTSAAALIQALLSETEVPRIRYSSIQPQDLTPELLACWEDSRLCRHFHLALQSGSERVLGAMRRRYDPAGFLDAVEWIRAAAPGAAITTDVIAGFPGETEGDFERTMAVVDEARFAGIHAFPYSPRPGTSAALLADDVPPGLKRERVGRLIERGRAGAARFRAGQIGATAAVLFEREADGAAHGLTDTYVPVIARRAPGAPPLANQIAAVRLTGLEDGAGGGANGPALIGEAIG